MSGAHTGGVSAVRLIPRYIIMSGAHTGGVSAVRLIPRYIIMSQYHLINYNTVTVHYLQLKSLFCCKKSLKIPKG